MVIFPTHRLVSGLASFSGRRWWSPRRVKDYGPPTRQRRELMEDLGSRG